MVLRYGILLSSGVSDAVSAVSAVLIGVLSGWLAVVHVVSSKSVILSCLLLRVYIIAISIIVFDVIFIPTDSSKKLTNICNSCNKYELTIHLLTIHAIMYDVSTNDSIVSYEVSEIFDPPYSNTYS